MKHLMTWTFALLLAAGASAAPTDDTDVLDTVADNAAGVAGNIDSSAASFEAEHRDSMDRTEDNMTEVGETVSSAAHDLIGDPHETVDRERLDSTEENMTEVGENLSSAAHDLIGDPHEEDHTAVNASIEDTVENIEEVTAPIGERIGASAASFEEEHREGLDNLENRLRGFGDRLGRFGRRNSDED